MQKPKLEAGYYIAGAPATGNAMADSRYAVFRWTIAEQRIVDRVRHQLRPLRRSRQWYSVTVGGAGPRVHFFETLPDWVYDLAGFRDVLDSGIPVEVSQEDAERLFAVEDDSVARVDCGHITVTDCNIYVGAYGKYCGTHWETAGLIQERK